MNSMIFKPHNPPTVASIGAPLSWGVEAMQPRRVVYISGQVGADSSGRIGGNFLEQVRFTWANVDAVLRSAGMTSANLIRTGIFVTTDVEMTEDLKLAFNRLRTEFLGESRPASTMIYVPALMHPDWLVEIDGVAVEL
jgi:2-iminobutanoate/2-iminopropanoate deaminase